MVSGPQGLQKSRKEDRIPKNAYAFAPGLLCRLQKIQKVCRLEHSVLFRFSIQGRNEKLFLFRKAFPGQSKKDIKNLRQGPELTGKFLRPLRCIYEI